MSCQQYRVTSGWANTAVVGIYTFKTLIPKQIPRSTPQTSQQWWVTQVNRVPYKKYIAASQAHYLASVYCYGINSCLWKLDFTDPSSHAPICLCSWFLSRLFPHLRGVWWEVQQSSPTFAPHPPPPLVEIISHAPILLFRLGSVHRGSAS